VIEHLIFRGVLKLYDPGVTETSLRKLCARYGALIKTGVLDAEARGWLSSSVDLAPSADKDAADGLEAFRKHARERFVATYFSDTRGSVPTGALV